MSATAQPADLEIRVLEEVDDLHEIRRLFERIWRTGAADPPITADLLRALVKAGNYASGAYLDGRLIGASIGFFSDPRSATLHSHITGVDPTAQARGVGLALKHHQRTWALARGAHGITWTYDPLIRRNAWFNLARLAAGVEEYLVDFYGPMDDDINRADPTDRLLVRWPLTEPDTAPDATPDFRGEAAVVLEASATGGPLHHPVRGRIVLVGTPSDVERLRLAEPAAAADWRMAVREVLGGLLADGARVRGFDRAGFYLVERSGR